MSKKQPKIYNIHQEKEEDIIEKIDSLSDEEEWEEVILKGKKAIQLFPDNPYFYYQICDAYFNLGEQKKAVSLLNKAVIKFPNYYEILFDLGIFYLDEEIYDKAEHFLSRALAAANDNLKVSDCYTHLGLIAIENGKTEEGIKLFRKALDEDPSNDLAADMLEDEYDNDDDYEDDPELEKMNSDYQFFLDIQSEKYLKYFRKKEFVDPSEAGAFTSLILSTWNEKIAPEKEKLDTLSIKQKTDWFYSIDIDFNAVKTAENELENDLKVIKKKFHFLTEEAQLLFPLILSVLHYKKYPKERFDAIMKGAKVEEYDIDLMTWASKIVETVLAGFLERKSSKREIIRTEAIKIAQKKLNKTDAEEVVDQLFELLKLAGLMK